MIKTNYKLQMCLNLTSVLKRNKEENMLKWYTHILPTRLKAGDTHFKLALHMSKSLKT